jgi:hypothetical protein
MLSFIISELFLFFCIDFNWKKNLLSKVVEFNQIVLFNFLKMKNWLEQLTETETHYLYQLKKKTVL